jgi:hypothetical protein
MRYGEHLQVLFCRLVSFSVLSSLRGQQVAGCVTADQGLGKRQIRPL